MTQLDLPAPTIPPLSRASATPRRGLPLVFWPIVSMVVMLPVLITLVVLLLT